MWIEIDGSTSLPGDAQARHSLQVSTTVLSMANRVSSNPALDKIVLIFDSLACHHRRCSFLSSLWTTVALELRRCCKLTCTLNLVQSGSRACPVPSSAKVLRVLSYESVAPTGLPLADLVAADTDVGVEVGADVEDDEVAPSGIAVSGSTCGACSLKAFGIASPGSAKVDLSDAS